MSTSSLLGRAIQPVLVWQYGREDDLRFVVLSLVCSRKSTTESCQEVDSYEISRSRITLGEVLGEGAFGQVRKGILKPEKSSEESNRSRNDHWTHFDETNHEDASVVAVKMLIGETSE